MQQMEKRYRFIDMIFIPFKCSFWSALILSILTILNGILPVVQIMVMTKIINKTIFIINNNTSISEVFLPILFMILLIGYQWISEEIVKISKIKIKLSVRANFLGVVTEKIAKLKYKNIEDNETWDLINRVSQKLEEQISNTFINVLGLTSLVINVIGIIAAIFVYVWWAAFVVLGLFIPLCYLAKKGAHQNYNAERYISETIRKYEYLGEVLTGRDSVEERALFNYTERINEDYQEIYNSAYKVRLDMRRKWFLKMKAGSFLTSFVLVLIIFVFLNPVLTGQITSGFFISIIQSIFGLIQKMSWGVTFYIDQITIHYEYCKDLNELLSLEEVEGATDLPSASPMELESIEFKDVYFKYPKTENFILKGMSFTIKKDKHYAFVGTNGAGKTTIIKLISGLYKDYEGSILINGKDLKAYTQSELKSNVAVLYQDFAKYQISLKDNILIGDINNMESNNVDKKLNITIKDIGLTEVVEGLPRGVETPLGKIKEDGQELSGGQWQRVAIARCLTNLAPLKILDEPTAALDPISESKLYEEFGNITKKCSTILISHRLGSTKLADEIFVIESGKVIEKGTHNELMNKEGIYSTMYNSQKDWYMI